MDTLRSALRSALSVCPVALSVCPVALSVCPVTLDGHIGPPHIHTRCPEQENRIGIIGFEDSPLSGTPSWGG
eukprot:1906755-Pyramimonas_sp.AAC.1